MKLTIFVPLIVCSLITVGNADDTCTDERCNVSGSVFEKPGIDPAQYSFKNLSDGWFEPAVLAHTHFRPLVHGFITESAFCHRSLLTETSFASGNEVLEVELDLPVTKRFSALLNIPYALDYNDETGFGDMSVGVRTIWAESIDYTWATILDVSLPIGKDEFSSNEFDLGFTLANWWYIGDGWSAQSNLGLAWTPDLTDSQAFVGTGMLAYSLDLSGGTSGFLARGALMLEGGIVAPLEGGDETGEIGLGAMFTLSNKSEFRIGYYRTFDDEGVFRIGSVWEF